MIYHVPISIYRDFVNHIVHFEHVLSCSQYDNNDSLTEFDIILLKKTVVLVSAKFLKIVSSKAKLLNHNIIG